MAVVVWSMIYQRLNSKGTLSVAVHFLAGQAVHWQKRSQSCKRVRADRISTGTGGYCLARHRMPMGLPCALPHERELVKALPPGHNQHGENHWPTLLLVAFHDVHSVWQPGRVGGRCMINKRWASRNWPAEPCRGCPPMRWGWRMATWESSRWPTAYSTPSVRLQGWMVSCRNPARKEEILYSFTTLDLKANRILALYKPRWHIETDLRSLKRTVNLHEVASKAKTGWEEGGVNGRQRLLCGARGHVPVRRRR